jgi:hypothetical protein
MMLLLFNEFSLPLPDMPAAERRDAAYAFAAAIA